jgi:hypothetical protein
MKVWFEMAGAAPVPVLTLGEDGSLSLSSGASVNLRPMVASRVLSTLSPGTWQLRARVLNPASGQILGETAREFIMR